MSVSRITYRHPREEDAPLIAEAINLSRRELEHERDVTLDELKADILEDESYDPQGSWLALDDESVAGFAWAIVDKHRVELGMTHGHVSIEIVPEYRDPTTENGLMARCLEYLRGRGMKVAQIRAPTEIGWTNDLVLGLGFHEVRRFFRMAYSRQSPPEAIELAKDLQLIHVPFKTATDEQITEFNDLFNESFVDHFDFAPMPETRLIRYREAAKDVGIIAAVVKDGKVIGASFNEEAGLYNEANGAKIGWIWVLGVAKDHRRQGLGTTLLKDGIRWLYSRGLDTALLYVDAENRHALGLYTSIGFEVVNESVIYRLDL